MTGGQFHEHDIAKLEETIRKALSGRLG